MISWLRRSAWFSLSFALLCACAQADDNSPDDETSEEGGSSGTSGASGTAGESGSSGSAGSGAAGSAGSGAAGSGGTGGSGGSDAGSSGSGGTEAGSGGTGGSGGSAGTSGGGSLDQLKIPPPSAQTCNTEGQVGNDCGSQYLMCRIYDEHYGRCEGCTNCGKVGDACTNNTTCPISAQCYAGFCRELCVLSQMTCAGSGVCTPVGNDTAGVCL